MQEVEITISNELDTNTYVIGGNGIRGSLPEGVVTVTGRIKAMFENATLYNKAINGTESSLVLTFTSGTHSLTIAVDELYYQRQGPAIETSGGIWLDLPFTGFYGNDADASGIMVTLVNAQATYPG